MTARAPIAVLVQSDKLFALEILRNGEPMTLEYTVQ